MSQRSDARRGASTRAVHGPGDPPPGPVGIPIVHSATFSFESLDAQDREQARGAAGAFYQRHGHPTLHACEERLAALEEAEAALLFPSGMAAIACAFMARLRPGDHVVTLRQGYGGTLGLLRWGVERCGWSFSLVDARDPGSWADAFTPATRLVHVESPTNPVLDVVDLHEAAQLARRHGAWLTVDNTIASPVGQHPLAHGADLVLYSATKSIGGHSDLLAGVAAGPRDRVAALWEARTVTGPVPDPELAWRVERSLKTLALRVRTANENALELAVRLETHPAVARVFYPGLIRHPGHEIARRQMRLGFGPLLAFEVKGGDAAARAVVEALRLVRLAPSLGGVESLATLPALTSHVRLTPAERAAAGIPDGCVRLSVGIEDEADLWSDLERALARAPRA